jgi:hypothetical protein
LAKFQELVASSSNSLKFLTLTNPLACFPKWTMTLNQNTCCAQLVADYPEPLNLKFKPIKKAGQQQPVR